MSIAIMGDSFIDQVLARANVYDVLSLAGIAPPANEKKNIRCPLPNHADSEPSFHVQSSGKGYRCFGCGKKGGVFELTVALGLTPTMVRALDFLAEFYDISKGASTVSRLHRAARPLPQFEMKPPTPIPTITSEEQASFNAAIKASRKLVCYQNIEAYSRFRGIEDGLAALCRVGAHTDWLGGGDALIFPGYDRTGNLVCAQGRYLSPTAAPKTKSKGKVSLGVFSTPNAFAKGLGPVAIVEAPIDALLLAQVGLPSIALFGKENRPAWLPKALAFRDIILALDDDEPGNKAADRIRAWLNLGGYKTRMLFDGAKDPGELWSRSPAKLAQLVEEAIKAADPLRLTVRTSLEAVTNLGKQVFEALPIAPEANITETPSLLAYAASVLG